MRVIGDIRGTRVAVSGVTSGIGRGIARAFTGAGAHVTGIGRRAALGRALEQELSGLAGTFTFVAGDMAIPSDVRRFVETACDTDGRLDVLVNNAGTVGDRPVRAIDDIDDDFWNALVGANLTSTFNGCREALPALRRTSGVIVNVGSGAGESVGADMLAYRTAKAGVMHFTRCLAAAVAAEGVRVHNLIMHSVETPGGERVMAHRAEGMDPVSESAMRAARARLAVQPLDVAHGVLELLADPSMASGPGFEVR